MRYTFLAMVIVGLALVIQVTPAHAATLRDRVNEAFRVVFGRPPTLSEHTYWDGRVVRGEKTSFEALRDAMYYQKGQTPGPAVLGTTTTIPVSADDKTSMIKAVLPLFISIYGNNPTDAEKAWWRKRISCGEIKKYKDLVASMKFHYAKKARKGSAGICGGTATATSSSGSSGVLRRAVAGISSHPMGDEVRIGIYNTDGSAITVTSDGKFQVREGRDKILATIAPDEAMKVSWSGGKHHVRGAGKSFDTAGKIRFVPLNQAIMKIASFSDPSATYPGKNYNRFRGVVEIRKCDGCGELWAINELRTEYYLRGLGETSGNGPEEYLKALGIAARTYVLYHKIITGGRRVAQDFDIGATALDQIYRGYEYELITPRMATTFNQVKGIIVTDSEGDKPVSTVYFSDSDGRTRSAQEVWNSSRFPYLQSVDDPHHASSSCKGHCVGMSAQGAYGFAAKDNFSFQKILKHYYKGVSLVKAY